MWAGFNWHFKRGVCWALLQAAGETRGAGHSSSSRGKEGRCTAQRCVYFYPSLFQGSTPPTHHHHHPQPNLRSSSLRCPWSAVEMGVGRSPCTPLLLLLLPPLLLGFSEALREEWKPGNYSDTAADATRFLDDYNSTAEEVFFFSVSASWNYNTNITTHNSQLQVGRPSVWTLHFQGVTPVHLYRTTRSAPFANSLCVSLQNGSAPTAWCFFFFISALFSQRVRRWALFTTHSPAPEHIPLNIPLNGHSCSDGRWDDMGTDNKTHNLCLNLPSAVVITPI